IVGTLSDGTGNHGFLETTVPNPAPPPGTAALMIMSNPSTGTYEVYNVGGNAILAAYELIQVGTSWTFAALGTFQAGDSSDMLATARPERFKPTTSAATTSPTRRSSARSDWTGILPASATPTARAA